MPGKCARRLMMNWSLLSLISALLVMNLIPDKFMPNRRSLELTTVDDATLPFTTHRAIDLIVAILAVAGLTWLIAELKKPYDRMQKEKGENSDLKDVYNGLAVAVGFGLFTVVFVGFNGIIPAMVIPVIGVAIIGICSDVGYLRFVPLAVTMMSAGLLSMLACLAVTEGLVAASIYCGLAIAAVMAVIILAIIGYNAVAYTAPVVQRAFFTCKVTDHS